jgi:hypothetical protein
LWRESLHHATDSAQQTGDGMFGGLAQMRLQFAEGHLDRIEVRIPAIVTTRTDASRPPIPIDRDQCDSAVRCIADLSVLVRRQAGPSP